MLTVAESNIVQQQPHCWYHQQLLFFLKGTAAFDMEVPTFQGNLLDCESWLLPFAAIIGLSVQLWKKLSFTVFVGQSIPRKGQYLRRR